MSTTVLFTVPILAVRFTVVLLVTFRVVIVKEALVVTEASVMEAGTATSAVLLVVSETASRKSGLGGGTLLA